MPRFLLDTNILSYTQKKRPPAVLARFEKLQPGEAVMSVISLGEMVYGASKSARKVDLLTQLDHLRRFLQVAPLPEAAAEAYGAIRAELENRGRLIGNNDLWIAAHAIASSLTLVTNNEKEFARIDGLAIENWVS
jgi:tRNA(fMet)-specific endonuclease VapC